MCCTANVYISECSQFMSRLWRSFNNTSIAVVINVIWGSTPFPTPSIGKCAIFFTPLPNLIIVLPGPSSPQNGPY